MVFSPTPRTWVSGETATAAEMNGIRDALNQLLGRDTFIRGDANMVFGTALTDWDTPKIRLDFQATVTTSAGGVASVAYPTAFPKGVSYCVASPANPTNNVGSCRAEPAFLSLSQWAGYCFTPAGVALASGLSVTLAIQAVGW